MCLLLLRFSYIIKNHTVLLKLYIGRRKYCRNFLPGEGWSSPRKKFCVKNFMSQENFPVIGGYFLSQEEVSRHKKKFPAIVRYFLSQEEILSAGSYLLSQEEISCHRKKFLVRKRNILSQKEISCQRQKCPVTGRNFLALEETSCHK